MIKPFFLPAIASLFAVLLPTYALGESPDYNIAFLDALTARDGTPYIAPKDVHDDYRMMIYVNVSERTGSGQRMWVLERDDSTQPWRLAMWDQDYWESQGVTADQEPPFSWIVSTGRRYPGMVRAGPTPVGFFNIDDRGWRHSKGWVRHDIVDIMYIDLHYSSGRASGVAFHGTPKSEYKHLGTAESHGCVRMTQPNARGFYEHIHRFDGLAKSKNPLWGEVPRFYRSTNKKGIRQSYRRDGQLLRSSSGAVLKKTGYRVGLMFFTDDQTGTWPQQIDLKPKVKPDLTLASVDTAQN